MSVSTTKDENATEKTGQAHNPDWLTLLFWVAIVALFAIAIGMRLYQLGLPFDRDGYDEGVYWQSLRAMGAGHALYKDIFYSQPPFFLLSTFPSYILFGGSLWSARLGIALVSLVGLLGAYLLGKALSGRLGAIAALLLAVVDPLYLAQSQTIQAEASSAAFSFLAMGLALFWWKYPSGKRGLLLAVLTGVTVALSILSKLLGVALLIPIGMLMLTRLWQISVTKLMNPYIAIVAGILAFLLTTILVMLPFLGSFQAMVASVITFHTDAASMLSTNSQFSQSGNLLKVESALTTLLALAALYGTAAALLRQDWRVLPLLGWLLATAFLLWRQVPLFSHHFVSLTPPLIALSVMGIADPSAYRRVFATASVSKVAIFLTWAAVLLILLTAILDARQDRSYYRNAAASSVDSTAQLEARVAADLRAAIAPDQQVVTDGQFVAALANRDTPPALVDTSMVRIETHYLTLGQLESIASQSQVHAVLFFTGRFHLPDVAAFHAWVAQHFRLLHNYGGGRELWVR